MASGALSALHDITATPRIRPASFYDVPDIVELGRAFFAVSDMQALAAFCPASFAHSIKGMIDGDNGILLVADVGGAVVGMAGARSH